MVTPKLRNIDFLATLLVAGAVVVAVAQPASAADVRYANNKSTGKYSVNKTATLPKVKGGRVGANVDINNIYLHIETWTNPPGASTAGMAAGGSPGYVYLSHPTKTSHHSKCYWTFPRASNISSIKMTCYYKK